MDDIISYANSKGIELVPALNVPGHMGAILRSSPTCATPAPRAPLI